MGKGMQLVSGMVFLKKKAHDQSSNSIHRLKTFGLNFRIASHTMG